MQVGTPRLEAPVPARNMMRDGRAEPREAAKDRRATLFHRGLAISVPVLNVSAHGAALATEVKLKAGDEIVVGFDGGAPVFAIVRWCEDGRVGIQFRS